MSSRWVIVEDCSEWQRLFDAHLLSAKPGAAICTEDWYDMYLFPDTRHAALQNVLGLLVEDE